MNNNGNILATTNEEGLGTKECLDFILGNSGNYVNVLFGASYDINMILKDVPMFLLKRLHGQGKQRSGEYIRWGQYVLQYRPRKSFFIGKYKEGERRFIERPNGKRVPNYESSTTIWDVFGFFQGSFLKALQTYFTPEECVALGIDKIKAGKERRSQFSQQEMQDFIIPYTQLECTALVALMERLRGHLMDENIILSRWDGSGAISSYILKREEIKKYHGFVPPDVEIACQHAYGGGRIELVQYGHYVGYSWHGDIRSAYPRAMLELLDHSQGKWTYYEGNPVTRGDKPTGRAIYLYDVSWDFPPFLPFYPFFVRDQFGQIIYPRRGRNWIWYPEYDSANRSIPKFGDFVHVHGKWTFETDSTAIPFQFVQELYDYRLKLKKEGKGSEKVIKLGINGLYGKTVQQIGYNPETKRRPPFFFLPWGGLITSFTRATMFEVAYQNASSIIAFATDGIWSKSPLLVTKGLGLGEWDVDELKALTIVQSGVYWTTLPDGTEHQFSRGFNPDELTREKVIQGWKNKEATIETHSTRFVTLGSALSGEERFLTKWRQWVPTPRVVSLGTNGTNKRISASSRNPSRGLVPTYAQENSLVVGCDFPYPDECRSRPYPLVWDVLKGEILEEAISMEIQEVDL